jgi:hypothetical protein
MRHIPETSCFHLFDKQGDYSKGVSMRQLYRFLISIFFAISVSSTATAGWKTNLVVAGGGFALRGLVQSCIKSAPCRAKGVEYVAQAVVTLLASYGIEKIKPCLIDEACRDGLIAAITSGASIPNLASIGSTALLKRTGPGEGIIPPGDCKPEYHDEMSRRVDDYCKTGEESKACSMADNISQLDGKLRQAKLCFVTRIKREQECFRGGNGGHREAIENTQKKVANCYAILQRKIQ